MGRAKGQNQAVAVASRRDAFTAIVGDDRGVDRPDAPLVPLTLPAPVGEALGERELTIFNAAIRSSTQEQHAARFAERMLSHDPSGVNAGYVDFINTYADLLGVTDPPAMDIYGRALGTLTSSLRGRSEGLRQHSDRYLAHEHFTNAFTKKLGELTGFDDPEQRELFAKHLLGPAEYAQRRISSLQNNSHDVAEHDTREAFSDETFLTNLITSHRNGAFAEAARLAAENDLPDQTATDQLRTTWRRHVDELIPLPPSHPQA